MLARFKGPLTKRDVSGGQKVRSLPAIRLEGFAAVAAFALAGGFLTTAEQRLGDDGFGLVRPLWLAHGEYSRWVWVESVRIIGHSGPCV